MSPGAPGRHVPDAQTEAFYAHVLATLCEGRIPYLVGGAYALQHYVGIIRHTKDLDVFVRPRHRDRALEVLARAGYCIEGVFHWIGKAYCVDDWVDVISSSMNGVTPIDDGWFEHGVAAQILGLPVTLCAPEELIWTKAFVMERERYDGADVAHLLRACARYLDWARLVERFGSHWPVLLSHLILYRFIYPSERPYGCERVISELLGRMQDAMANPPAAGRLCQGTLLSWRQYLVDVEEWGYEDARRVQGYMTEDEIGRWTGAFRDG